METHRTFLDLPEDLEADGYTAIPRQGNVLLCLHPNGRKVTVWVREVGDGMLFEERRKSGNHLPDKGPW